MKHKEFFVLLTLALLVACEEPYRATDVYIMAPRYIQTEFSHQYPSARNVVWSHYDAAIMTPIDWELAGWVVLDPGDYLVRFDQDNDYYYAWYDDRDSWIGTACIVRDYHTLPGVVSNTIRMGYCGYTITGVSREFQGDQMYYEVELRNSNTKTKLLLDSNGNVVRQKTKSMY